MSQIPQDSPQYTECFVAFIDILGFRTLVKDSERDPELIATLVTALNRIALDTPQATFTKAQRDEAGQLEGYNTWVLQVRPFSDCICLFLPRVAGRLSWLLSSIRYIHDRMLELGVCIRGAVTIGGMYWEDTWGEEPPGLQNELRTEHFKAFGQSPPPATTQEVDPGVVYQADAGGFPITLGPGLVEAYELETKRAVYPRVIASESLHEYLDQHGGERAFPLTSPSPEDSGIPIRTFFRTDTDDIQFLDLLHPKVARQDTERITREQDSDGTTTWRWEQKTASGHEIARLASALAEKALKQPLSDEIRAKYEWLRSYASQAGDGNLDPEGQ
jgi:hypothetical protein